MLQNPWVSPSAEHNSKCHNDNRMQEKFPLPAYSPEFTPTAGLRGAMETFTLPIIWKAGQVGCSPFPNTWSWGAPQALQWSHQTSNSASSTPPQSQGGSEPGGSSTQRAKNTLSHRIRWSFTFPLLQNRLLSNLFMSHIPALLTGALQQHSITFKERNVQCYK